jgi:hypothetical protein
MTRDELITQLDSLETKPPNGGQNSCKQEVGMRIDSYVKFVLTVIALCLMWLSIGGPALLPAARAAQTQTPPKPTSGYERVLIAGWVDEKGAEHTFPIQRSMDGKPISIAGVPVTDVK